MGGDDFHKNLKGSNAPGFQGARVLGFKESRDPGVQGTRVQGFEDTKAEELGTSNDHFRAVTFDCLFHITFSYPLAPSTPFFLAPFFARTLVPLNPSFPGPFFPRPLEPFLIPLGDGVCGPVSVSLLSRGYRSVWWRCLHVRAASVPTANLLPGPVDGSQTNAGGDEG